MVLNSLSFCLSVKLLISPSYLNEILAGYSNLGCRLFSFFFFFFFNSSTRAPDLKSSSGNAGLLLQPREAALLAVGAAMFIQNAPSSSSAAAAPTPAPTPSPPGPPPLVGSLAVTLARGRAGGPGSRCAVPAGCAPGVRASGGSGLQRQCVCGPDTLSCGPKPAQMQ